MLDLNTTLETIRALAPDLRAILARLGGPLEPEALQPVLRDYLDATCPGWRRRACWMTVVCASCDAPLSRPTRSTTERLEHPGDQRGEFAPVVQSGRFLWVGEATENILIRWNGAPPEREGVILNPEDARGFVCEDTGCCGYAGQPGNCACTRCGAVVATLHTDCCGWHTVHTRPGWSRLVWGLPELSEEDRATLDWLKTLPHASATDSLALDALRGLAGPLSLELEAEANALFGPLGAIVEESMGSHRSQRGWQVGLGEECGRWVTRDAQGALIEVTFCRSIEYERHPYGPRLQRGWDGQWVLEWLSGERYGQAERSWTLSEPERDAVLRWLDAPRSWGDAPSLRRELFAWMEARRGADRASVG